MRFVYYEIAEYLQAHRLFLKGKPYVLVITPREITYDGIQQKFVLHTDLKAEKYSRNLSSDRLETKCEGCER